MANEQQNADGQNQMTDNGQEVNAEGQGGEEKTTWTKEEVDALIKETEKNFYVKGKTDEQKKNKERIAERERQIQEETEKKLKLANLSDLQRAQAEAEDYKGRFEQLEKKVQLAERTEETRKILADKGVSDFYLPYLLAYDDPEEMLKQIEEIKVGREADIQKGIEARINTHVPKQNSEPPKNGLNLDEYRKRMLSK